MEPHLAPTGTHQSEADLWRASLTATAPNKHIVLDPTIPPPGFTLPRRQWTALDRLCTAQGICGGTLYRWRMRADAICDCERVKTMGHITSHYPLQKLSGGLLSLHQLTPQAATWLQNLDIKL